MKKKIINVFLMMAVLTAALGSFVSCKDSDEDMYSDLQGKLADQNASLNEVLNAQISAMQLQLDKVKAEQATSDANNQKLKDSLDYYYTKAQTDAEFNRLEGLVNQKADAAAVDAQLKEAVDKLNAAIDEAKEATDSDIKTLTDQINKLNVLFTDVDNLTNRVTDLETLTAGWGDDVKLIRKDAAAALALAKADSIRLDEYEKYKESSSKDLDSLAAQMTADRETAAANYAKANAFTAEEIAKVHETINGEVDAKLGDLTKAYESADKALQDQITALQNLFRNVMSKLITSINVNGTVNPVYGYAALPVDMRSNVLVAYYGYAPIAGVVFPTSNSIYYVKEGEALSAKDMQMLGVKDGAFTKGAKDCLISDADDNAGTLYLTLNPTSVDFEGTKFALVNSVGEESGVKLGAIEPSNYKLTFGYTRAASKNGFYEAKAHLDSKDIQNVKAKINIQDLKEAITDVLDRKNGINVTNVVTTLYSNFNGFLDANALRATWKTTDIKTGEEIDASTYSQYGIAATAIKPLSYAFMKDAHYTKLPGIERMENFIANMIDKINIKIPQFDVNINTPDIKGIEMVKLDSALLGQFLIQLEVPVEVTVPGQTLTGITVTINGNTYPVSDVVVGDKTVSFKVPVTVDMRDQIKELFDELNKPMGDVNEMITEINKYISDVNKLIGQLDQINDLQTSIDQAKDDIKTQLTKYLDTFNTKVCNLINSTNKALQPVLFVKTKDGFAKLSQALNNPSKVPGNKFILVPTSYTAEVLAPAYKKLVGVTNVYSLDRTKNAQANGGVYKTALDKANNEAGIATVYDGGKQTLSFSAEKGYIYELVYTAVDYSGKIAAKKFYVMVR